MAACAASSREQQHELEVQQARAQHNSMMNSFVHQQTPAVSCETPAPPPALWPPRVYQGPGSWVTN
eukprot:1161902-Pelagomonas_calceolata.AAC.20